MNTRVLDRTLVYGGAILLAFWVLIPLYLVAISAFTPQARLFDYPKPLVPTTFSTETMQFFLEARGVIPSVINSILVALFTIAFGLALGPPAGYALARFRFRGRQAAQVLAGLGTSPLGFKFAGGLFMAMPAVAFIFLIRRYLMNLWGSR